MLFLVNCNVQTSYCRKPELTETKVKNHIVEANNENEAVDKLQDFYWNKDVEGLSYNHVDINYCNKIIT